MAGARVLALLTIVLLLSGCSKGDGKVEETSPASVVSASDGSGGTGGIQGIVVDDTFQPIKGILVGLKGMPDFATTDDAGNFAFTGLTAGSYQLYANGLGYEAAAQAVEVLEGETAEVKLTLNTITIVTEYVDGPIEEHMFMALGLGLIATTGTFSFPGDPLGKDIVTVDHNVSVDVVSFVSELAWQPTAALAAKEFWWTMGWNETRDGSFVSFEKSYADQTGPSPLKLVKTGSFSGLSKMSPDNTYAIRSRAWVPGQSDAPPIIVITMQQPMTAYTTAFYGKEAPADFSGLPDA